MGQFYVKISRFRNEHLFTIKSEKENNLNHLFNLNSVAKKFFEIHSKCTV